MEVTECRESEGITPYRRRSGSLIESFFGLPFCQFGSPSYAPPVEIKENEDEFRVYMELPGVGEQDVSTTFTDGNLTIKGEKKSTGGEGEELCYCSERCYGTFERTVPISSSVDAEHVSAHLDKGVLEVILPKREEARPRRIEVKSK